GRDLYMSCFLQGLWIQEPDFFGAIALENLFAVIAKAPTFPTLPIRKALDLIEIVGLKDITFPVLPGQQIQFITHQGNALPELRWGHIDLLEDLPGLEIHLSNGGGPPFARTLVEYTLMEFKALGIGGRIIDRKSVV